MQLLRQHWHGAKKFGRLFDREVEYRGDVAALVEDLESFPAVAPAMAGVARHIDVRQKMHLDLDQAVALASFAAAALDVERKAAGFVAALARDRRFGEQFPDRREQARVGGRIAARRAADRALIDGHDLVEVLLPLERRIGRGLGRRSVQRSGDGRRERVVDERRLA